MSKVINIHNEILMTHLNQSASDHSGSCEKCEGTGTYHFDPDGQKILFGDNVVKFCGVCWTCNGTGIDPKAQLKLGKGVDDFIDRLKKKKPSLKKFKDDVFIKRMVLMATIRNQFGPDEFILHLAASENDKFKIIDAFDNCRFRRSTDGMIARYLIEQAPLLSGDLLHDFNLKVKGEIATIEVTQEHCDALEVNPHSLKLFQTSVTQLLRREGISGGISWEKVYLQGGLSRFE